LLKLPIVECTFIKKLNRCVGVIEVNGEGKKAFCIPKQGGKTDFVLIGFLEKREKGAIVNTRTQANAFEGVIDLGLIKWLKGCKIKNVKVGNSRLDCFLDCNGEEILVEMKSVVLREEDYAMHPDCPSLRREAYKRAYASERKRQKSNDDLHRYSTRS